MARYWDDKDGNGKKLTDGRVCLVIEPDDPNLPAIRTYGRDKDEVLEKVAKTAETAQAEIHRLRSARPAVTPTPTRTAAVPLWPPPGLTADEQARATADLSNPAKSVDAVKTLLRGAGFDVDKQNFREDTNRMALVAQEWERNHPDKLWTDERNQRLLIDTAVLHFGYRRTMNAEAIDAAYNYLLERNMLYAVQEETTEVPPGGSQEPRTPVRNATSYRSTALRATPPARLEKPRYTREELDKLTSRDLADKIKNEPGFVDWYNKQFAARTA